MKRDRTALDRKHKQRYGYRPIKPPTTPRQPPEKCPDCGKFCYKTKKLAAAAMVAMVKHEGCARDDWTYYKCSGGSGWWHIGHVHRVNVEQNRPYRPKPPNKRVSHQHDDPTTDV